MHRLDQTYLNGNIAYILLRQVGGVEAIAIWMAAVRSYTHKRVLFEGEKTKKMKEVAKTALLGKLHIKESNRRFTKSNN